MSLTRGRELPIGARAGLLDPKHVKAMGSARWLYDWILWRVTFEQEGVGLVLGGSPVRCEEIAADLGVGLRTIYRWMNRLRGPYIRTRHVVFHGRHGLAIEVLKSKKFRPSKPSGTPRFSTVSTISTANPVKSGRANSARFGRDNPARIGRAYKEYRKPFTESYGKRNSGFLEALPGQANRPKANPPSPPALENQNQNQSQNQNQNQNQIPPAYAEASANNHRQDDAGAARKENGLGSSLEGDQERELLAELRRMIGAKGFDVDRGSIESGPGESGEKRRELLERQRCALLQRAGQESQPP